MQLLLLLLPFPLSLVLLLMCSEGWIDSPRKSFRVGGMGKRVGEVRGGGGRPCEEVGCECEWRFHGSGR